MYIDPKDQPHHPDWPPIYIEAHERRRAARLAHCKVTKEIERLDEFCALYEQIDAQFKTSELKAKG